MIELRNLSKKFGDLQAVRNINLTIPNGELFTLLGPNGAGKTTTLKMTTGLIAPTEGKIIINGVELNREPEKAKRMISYIPDEPFLYPELTGREFIIFVSRLYEMEKETIMERMEELFREFRIGDWIDLPASEYSHGMRQKVVFIQALIHNPEIIVIDEPMVGLDPVSGRTVKRILRERVTDGTCVFMSTHSLSVAEEISDRVGVIDNGRLIEVGIMEDLKVNPFSTLEDIYFALTEEETDVM
ncbi:MAG: ABC transporter ATP-binding protein [candidate division WOR-3 bacterium]|nr:ABC transporter ATP-binding protein [candidate division WOR-3 bacterium]